MIAAQQPHPLLLSLLVLSSIAACRAERPGDLGSADDGAARSQCPAPTALGPNELPSGYLAPVVVQLARVVDGDTAHFVFRGREEIVRFLYVNTEESHGEETTSFGVATERRAREELESAREISVAVRESPSAPGRPDRDAYDRWLGLVFVDGALYQTHLVQAGMSAYYTRYGCAPDPVHTNLVEAEAEASAARRGIWSPGHPTDYQEVLTSWIGHDHCRPDPFRQPYCR